MLRGGNAEPQSNVESQPVTTSQVGSAISFAPLDEEATSANSFTIPVDKDLIYCSQLAALWRGLSACLCWLTEHQPNKGEVFRLHSNSIILTLHRNRGGLNRKSQILRRED